MAVQSDRRLPRSCEGLRRRQRLSSAAPSRSQETPLFAVAPGQTYSMREFVDAQEEQSRQFSAALAAFYEETASTAARACEEGL